MKQLALLPVAPLRFTVWVADKVAEEADQKLNSPQAYVQRLREIEDARVRGDLTDEEAAELEAEVIERASGVGGPHG
ncbi:MAG TPA: gas vesicle protein GvpG [Solirubrobacteraceae bacterium]|nr:gas vesicle protein GvpG [Solirubrobacteraceae bacterium]